MSRVYGHGEYGIISGMERFFNIAGPCNPARHYMLPAMARLPDVAWGGKTVHLFRC